MPFVPFLRSFRTSPASAPPATPSPELLKLQERVEALERAEAVRAAEHFDRLQALERLFKRISMRLTRAGDPAAMGEPQGESVLSLRERLRR